MANKSYTSADIYAALVKNPGLTSKEIAQIVGCSDGAVRQMAKRNGLSFVKPKQGNPPANTRRGPATKPYIPKPKLADPPKVETKREIKPGMMGSGRVACAPMRIKETW